MDKIIPCNASIPVRDLVQVPVALLLIQLSANDLGKAVENGSYALFFPTHVRDLDPSPGFNLAQPWPLCVQEPSGGRPLRTLSVLSN